MHAVLVDVEEDGEVDWLLILLQRIPSKHKPLQINHQVLGRLVDQAPRDCCALHCLLRAFPVFFDGAVFTLVQIVLIIHSFTTCKMLKTLLKMDLASSSSSWSWSSITINISIDPVLNDRFINNEGLIEFRVLHKVFHSLLRFFPGKSTLLLSLLNDHSLEQIIISLFSIAINHNWPNVILSCLLLLPTLFIRLLLDNTLHMRLFHSSRYFIFRDLVRWSLHHWWGGARAHQQSFPQRNLLLWTHISHISQERALDGWGLIRLFNTGVNLIGLPEIFRERRVLPFGWDLQHHTELRFDGSADLFAC